MSQYKIFCSCVTKVTPGSCRFAASLSAGQRPLLMGSALLFPALSQCENMYKWRSKGPHWLTDLLSARCTAASLIFTIVDRHRRAVFIPDAFALVQVTTVDSWSMSWLGFSKLWLLCFAAACVSGIRREYFFRIEEVSWNYAPSGMNVIQNRTVEEDEWVYSQHVVLRCFSVTNSKMGEHVPALMSVFSIEVFPPKGSQMK